MDEPIKILLIEDNLSDARLIQMRLLGTEQVRFQIQNAESLHAGLSYIRNEDYNAILLDLSLPDSFGMETLRAVREATPVIPIIVLTGFADQQIGLRALQYGAQDYLVKDDTDAKLLVRSIQYAIKRKEIELAEQEQRRFAEALSRTAALLTSTLDLNEVLDRMLANIEYVVEHDATNVVLIDGDEVYIARRRDKHSERDALQVAAESKLQLTSASLLEYMKQTRQPVIVHNLQQAENDTFGLASEANVRAYVGAPIMLHNEILGYINIFCFEPDAYTSTDTERLVAFAEHAAIAIQNAKLYAHSRELASLQERQRLARELHDSVSQTLFTCQTMSESALLQFENNPPKAQNLLTQVHQLTTNALAEMRVLLLELRPAAMAGVSLRHLFEQYLTPLQNRLQLHVRMDIDPNLILPPDVQIALYRITQEALNNIVKHSKADKVNLHVEDTEAYLKLLIEDNGIGFDRAVIGPTNLGLAIMRERANGIDATLEIETHASGGTQISVVWPKQEKLTL